MLFRKMLREFRMNFGLFFSIFLLSGLAIAMFCTMEGHVLSQRTAREKYHEECNMSDLWMYGEGFSQEELDTVRNLDFVEAAQLRMSATGSTPDFAGVQVDFFLERENIVNTPYLIKGEKFDPADTQGIWLANAFAQRRGLDVGDDFTIEYNGIKFTRKIKGLIETPEYEYRQADGDADMYLENIAIVFMSYDAFPIRDYVVHLVGSGKITAKKVAENTKLLDEKLEQLKAAGLTVEDITQDMLLQVVDNLSDEKLAKMMPYTQMIIRTKDGGALAHEDEIAQAVDYDYSAIVDRKSVQGLVRLDSELDQHQAFAYVFVVIFVGIAVLVIATSMGRIVEKQRIQIGTMNALGMKRWKIVLHYISYSLLVSVLGVIVGLAGGVGLGAPAMIGMFEQYYIVPGSIGLSRKLAADMGIKVGDTIYWHIYSKNEWYEAVVGVIYRSCETQGIAYLREDYEKTGAEYTPTLLMTDDAGAKDVAALKYVTSVNIREDMIAAYEKSMEVINIMVFAMVIFSTVMIVVVLYNSGSLSFNERMKELATLKVMGLQSAQIRRLLTVQNIWLSIIGIIIGTPLGNMSLNAMMNSNGENFDYSLSVPVIDYIIAAIVLIISMLVSFMFTKRIKKLDLVETLKDVE